MSKSYEKAKGRTSKSPPFIMIRRDMIRSPAFRRLSPHASKLLLVLAVEYRGNNNGSLAIPFEAARQYGFTNKRTYYAALHELENKGFIEMTKPAVRRGRPTAARYAITWESIHEPAGEVKHDARPTNTASNLWSQWAPEQVAEVPPKKRNARGRSATCGGTEMPLKNDEMRKPRGNSATHKLDLAGSRGADLPPVYISTIGEGDDP